MTTQPDRLLTALDEAAKSAPTAEARLAAASLAAKRREYLASLGPFCTVHPAYEASNCPGCGTSARI